MSGTIEAELKFVLQPDEVDRLERSPALDSLAVGSPETADLVSVYFDTPDRALRQNDCTLRIRRGQGGLVQTAKLGSAAGSGLSSRTEIEVIVDGEAPDPANFSDSEASRRLRSLIDGKPLEPLFTVKATRTTRMLVTGAGDEVEFVLDRGEVEVADRRVPLVEAEFELKAGDLRSLYDAAKGVMSGVPIRFSSLSKADRGFRLLDGEEAAVAPVKAVDADLSPEMTVEQAFRAVMRSGFEQVVGNVRAVLETENSEGPHQLRVGLRRLRSAMTLFRPVLDKASAARLNEQMRGLGRLVGELRDVDVLIEEIVTPCRERIDVTGLVAVLSTRREAAKKKLATELSGPEAGAFLIDLAAYVEGRGWLSSSDLEQTARLSQPIGSFAHEAIHKRWRKVAGMGRDPAALLPEERHELRKSFKKLRYALDFLGDLLPGKDRKRLSRDVKSALEVLGYLNDVAMAESMAAQVSGTAAVRKRKDYPAIERAIGFCLGWHGATAERVWNDALGAVSLKKGAF